MQHDQKQLHEIAQDYPWYTFTIEEIAVLCNVSRDVVTRVRTAQDSPFFLNKCRPEWFLQWMRNHPEFQLTKSPDFRKRTNALRGVTLGTTPSVKFQKGGCKKRNFSKKEDGAIKQ